MKKLLSIALLHFLVCGLAYADTIPDQRPHNGHPNTRYREIAFSVDGNGSAITSGGTWCLASTPYSGVISAWNLTADQSGSIVIDVWKLNKAIPTVSNTITASSLPTLSSAQSAFNGAITGWTTAVQSGDVFCFHINSASTVQRVSLTIQITAY